LGVALEPITSAFDQRWHDGIFPAWQKGYREAQEARDHLAERASLQIVAARRCAIAVGTRDARKKATNGTAG